MARLTIQRQAILDLINGSGRHWNAVDLAHELTVRGNKIGIATVFRGLAALEADGLVSSMQLKDKKCYERAGKVHHDHMLCTACGAIEEFSNDTIESLQEEAAADKGFEITGHQLVLYGLCKKCSGSR